MFDMFSKQNFPSIPDIPFAHALKSKKDLQMIGISLRSSRFLSFPFPGGDRTSERKTRASEGARLGRAKNWGEVGRGWTTRGEGVGKKGILRSPHPLPLLLIFRIIN